MKKLISMISFILVFTFILTPASFAANETKPVQAYITKDIKIYRDYFGRTTELLIPHDANFDLVYPLSYNGSTYLPVRAVANLFGLNPVWDGEKRIITLQPKLQN